MHANSPHDQELFNCYLLLACASLISLSRREINAGLKQWLRRYDQLAIIELGEIWLL